MSCFCQFWESNSIISSSFENRKKISFLNKLFPFLLEQKSGLVIPPFFQLNK